MRENVPIASLTTMRLGAAARYVAEIETLDDLRDAYAFAAQRGLATYILGEGSNVIGRDEGFDGVILLNRLQGIADLGDGRFKGQSGEIFDNFVAFTVERGYSGMEAMSAVPGTLGAAPVQNVGAYGQEMSEVLESVEVYDPQSGESSSAGQTSANRGGNVVKFTTPEMKLGYRHSIFNNGPDAGRYFILSVTVKLQPGAAMQPPFYTSLQQYIDSHGVTDFSPASIRRMVTEIRADKLPDPKLQPSAGSFFKNIYLGPEEAKQAQAKGIPVWDGGKVPAGWLIEQAGLKGKELYGFKVSDKAALILVNSSATSYADLARARQAIIDAVHDKFGLQLEQEPVEIT